MYFYSGWFVAIFLVLACMHIMAWFRRRQLQLDAVEEWITRCEIRGYVLTVLVGVASMLLTFCGLFALSALMLGLLRIPKAEKAAAPAAA